MILNDDELRAAYDALGNLYRAIAALRADIPDTASFALLAEGPLHEIDRLRREIDEYTGVAAAEQHAAELWMRIAGKKARWRETSSSVVTAFLDALRKGVQAILAHNLGGRLFGRPSAKIQRAVDFEIVGFRPGSFVAGMSLPEPSQRPLFADVESESEKLARDARDALHMYLAVAEWAASGEELSTLELIEPDVAKRRIALRAVKSAIPRVGGGVDYLELSGDAVPAKKPIYLTQKTAKRVSAALEKAVAEHEETYTGDVREMDLDRRTFRLRNVEEIGEVPCHLADDLGPITATFLGKRARVIGTRTTPASALEVIDLEELELEPATDADEERGA
jgi:hypothetical protein